MTDDIRILLVEDNPGDVRLLREAFAASETPRLSVTYVDRLTLALERLRQSTFDIIITDLGLPDSQGAKTYTSLVAQAPDTPLIVLSSQDDDALALQAMQVGAQDYLVKGALDGQVLVRSIRYAIERHHTAEIIGGLNETLLRQKDNLTALHETTLDLLRERNVTQLFQTIIARLSNLLGVTHSFISVADGENLVVRAVGEAASQYLGVTLARGEGLAGRVWAAGQAIVLEDYQTWPNGLNQFDSLKLRATACVPIMFGAECAGVLGAAYLGDDERHFEPEQLAILDRFAALASLVFYNAELYEAAQHELAERRRAEAALRESEAKLNYLIHRFVPGAVAEQLMASKQEVRLGGERRTVSVLFADIRGYTALTEALDPPALMDLLNTYFGIVGRVILKYGGTINQYAGDMIMASFNAPDPQPDHAERAVQAALEAQAALTDHRWNSKESLTAEFGMGVNTGPVVVGYLGFEDRFDYATLGETTNIAFRLSSTAERGQVLIGPETLALVRRHVEVQALGPLMLKGRVEPLPVYLVEKWGRAS
jgi:class 3 adenylate cyclase/DNA-binding NarL/FixJ family response regulator